MNLSKRIISGIIAVLLLIAMLPTAVFAEPLMAASNVGGTSKGVDAMIAIESALSSKKIGKTTTVANDGYIGIPLEVSVYHGGDEPWQIENGVHWRMCSYCREEVDRGECSGGKANCASGAICSSCGNVYTEPDPNSHVSDGKWTYREDKHYSTCKNPGCGATIEEECSGGVATCKYRAICSTCKSNYGETLPHTYDSDCDTSCNVCRTNREAPHIATDEWKTNGESHWKECSCGEIFSTGTHVDENADGKCDTCSYDLPASDITPPPSPTPEGMSVGAIVGIAVGSTAAVGIGAFALIWFAIKKKSFADLLSLFVKK